MSGEVRVTLQTRSLGPGDIADLLGPACVRVERRCEVCDGTGYLMPQSAFHADAVCCALGCDRGWVPDGTVGQT